MKKIVVANIGNRSLIYTTKPDGAANNFIGDINKSFKDITKEIWDNKSFNNIELNIINAFLDFLIYNDDCPDEIHLFVSNQEGANNTHRRKDTLYAGYIIKELIAQKYKNDNINLNKIFVIEQTGIEVISAEKLIKEYRAFFKNQGNIEDNFYYIADSGGTPQQKTSLKIVAEYFLPVDKFCFYQIIEPDYSEDGFRPVQESDIQPLSDSKKIEYKKIITAQQVELLIDNGNYSAAISLLENSHIPKKITAKVKDCDNRIHGIRIPRLDTYLAKYYQNPANWQSIFATKSDYLWVCEALSIADWYFNKENWTRFVLALQNFIERFIKEALAPRVQDPIELSLQEFNNVTITNPKIKYNNGKGLATRLAFLKAKLGKDNDAMYINMEKCHSFFNINNKGIDILRNLIAHEGVGVDSLATIAAQVPLISEYLTYWKTELGLPVKNIFLSANEELIKDLQLL